MPSVQHKRRRRRRKRRRLLMEDFQKLIPNCYQRYSRTVLAFPCCLFHSDAADLAVWLWTMRIIPLYVQPVVAIIAMFIPRPVQPVVIKAAADCLWNEINFATATEDELQAWHDKHWPN